MNIKCLTTRLMRCSQTRQKSWCRCCVLRRIRAQKCDYIIAFGGGSPIDTAKAVKILTANLALPTPTRRRQSEKRRRTAGSDNTTAGTAAEMTSNAVIIDSPVKEVIIDPNIIPDIAVDDASVMLKSPLLRPPPQPAWMPWTHAVEALPCLPLARIRSPTR